MNCKPGELCVMVRSTAGNEGSIVETIRMVGRVRFINNTFDDCWLVRGLPRNFDGPDSAAKELGGDALIPDEFLRPRRGGEEITAFPAQFTGNKADQTEASWRPPMTRFVTSAPARRVCNAYQPLPQPRMG